MLENATPMPLPRVDPATVVRNDGTSGALKEPRVSKPGAPPSFILRKEDQASLEPIQPKNTGAAPANTVQTEGFDYEEPFTNHLVPYPNDYPNSAVGKLFFFIPQGASEPSGEVCLFCQRGDEQPHGYHGTALHVRLCDRNVLSELRFLPCLQTRAGNPAFHGGWAIRNLATWVSGASTYDYDIGFMQLDDDRGYGCNGSSGGRPIGSYTGWFGYTYGGDFSERQWDIIGYPAELPFGGNHQWDDEAATGNAKPFGTTNVIEVGNPQTGGTSGGPWVIGFDPQSLPATDGNNTAAGYANLVNGLNSFKWTNPRPSVFDQRPGVHVGITSGICLLTIPDCPCP